MDNQIPIRQLMLTEFERLQAKNSRFSLRSFAKRLGLKPSEASEILRGKRRITTRLAKLILAGIDADPSMYEETPTRSFQELSLDHFAAISNWYYYAILSLAELDDFNSTPQWIAARLGITQTQAKEALIKLKKLEMLVDAPTNTSSNTKSKKLIPNPIQFTTTNEIASLAVKKMHRQYLELAQQALIEIPLDQRDFSAMTMAIDPKKIPEAKKRITKFRRDLCQYLESGEKKSVYQICIQLFPLLKNETSTN